MIAGRVNKLSHVKPNMETVLSLVQDQEKALQVPMWKRVLDVTCILLGAPIVAPIFLLIAVYIKIVSPGPAFYRQARVGFQGRPFDCLKFRSMKVNADTGVHQTHLQDLIESDKPMTKMDKKGDPRLIPGAVLLRASGLDELPQLINVLRGEMSICGPRPCTPYEFEKYQAWHRERFDTLPGLTGLWQVSGKNRTTFSEMIRLDISYVRNKSVMLDLKIMFKTFAALADQIKESNKSR